uniref:Protein Wnt n=1 Tax=Urechis unicinctus TaxID=6432 RepID=A0A5B9GBC2_UREUN|nr:wingless [Urechis unicinctus]
MVIGMYLITQPLVIFLLAWMMFPARPADNNARTGGKKHRTRGTRWWNLASTQHFMSDNLDQPDPHHYINPSMQPLTRKQRRLVARNPGTMTAIARSARLALDECQFQFRHRRWNCPVSEASHGGSVFGKILKTGCRESSFIYAVTSAALSHSVARACSDGRIYTCSCGEHATRHASHRTTRDWQWGGCGDNMAFGYKFSKDFIDVAERGHDVRHMMNLHNNEAGRRHVRDEMGQECKCHGMSGSCSVKTCWMTLPHFTIVGNNIKARYDGASRIQQGNAGVNRKKNKLNLIPVDAKHKTPGRKDLVYFEKSPTFCDLDAAIGHTGTSGRVCNATSQGIDGCELMCCGRGFGSELYSARERCNCVFHWCCHVTCDACMTTKVRHVCL